MANLDVLGTLVRLSESDRPFGVQAEVLQAVRDMVVLLDEQFLVHSAVHKAVLRLLRNCVGDDIQEQLDGKKAMGAAGNATPNQPSEYEEDREFVMLSGLHVAHLSAVVNLLCILCSRIRTYRELLMIFFHDKHWYRTEPLFSVEEEDEDEEDEDETLDTEGNPIDPALSERKPSPTPSQVTIKSTPAPSALPKKAEYEFLLFNYLLRFVHREGKTGDFARAGLLFLMDVAMSPGDSTLRFTGDKLGSSMSLTDLQSTDPITDAALALAEYIVDGDFSEVLGAGLAAVYSVLPTKLLIRPPESREKSEGAGMVIGKTGPETEEEAEEKELTREKNQSLGLEESTNPDFKARLDHFLKSLEFLQDVLRRNAHTSDGDSVEPSFVVGSAIVNAIVDAVRRTFFENVLYPSILECSDTDGSAVAVMSYIDIMINTLKHGQLGDVLVEFLLSEDNEQSTRPRQRHQPMLTLGKRSLGKAADKEAKHRKRKSTAMALLEMEAPDSTKQTEYFTSMGRFTLKDLLLANLRSKSQPTASAALQLLQTMVNRHCGVCVDKLLIVAHDPKATSFPEPLLLPPVLPLETSENVEHDEEDEEMFVYPGAEKDANLAQNVAPITLTPFFLQPLTTISTHEREMGLYLTLVSRVDPTHSGEAFSTGYDHYLGDALLAIESEECFQEDIDPEVRDKRKHRLNPNDPLLTSILESLRTFFANSPEFNIALTGALATLALCPDRSLAGWLTFALKEPALGGDDPDDPSLEDGDDRSIDFRIDEELSTESHRLPAASMDEQSRPVIHAIFLGLVSQLERYRQQVDDFDKYLLERRQGLLFSENLTDALTLALEPESIATPKPAPVTTAPERPPRARTSTSSSLLSLFTPRKSKTAAQAASTPEPSTPSKRIEASPFAPHYKQTSAVVIEPYTAPIPASSSWTPVKPKKWDRDAEDVFASSGWGGSSEGGGRVDSDDEQANDNDEQSGGSKRITLSHLLDNVVVLEESLKELAAIIQARRSLAIDSIRYV